MTKTSMPRGVLGYLGWLKATGHASPLQETLLKLMEVAKQVRKKASRSSLANREQAILFAKTIIKKAKQLAPEMRSNVNQTSIVRDGEPWIELPPDALKL